MPAPPATERTTMIVWPSICASEVGQALGRLFGVNFGVRIGPVPVTLGRLAALFTIPLTLFLYFNKIVPRIPAVIFGFANPFCRQYRLTNQRVIDDYPFSEKEWASISLDAFDTVEIDVRPGQEWFSAGDLVFNKNGAEVFRLAGVSRPAAFRQACLNARQAKVGVDAARAAGFVSA